MMSLHVEKECWLQTATCWGKRLLGQACFFKTAVCWNVLLHMYVTPVTSVTVYLNLTTFRDKQ